MNNETMPIKGGCCCGDHAVGAPLMAWAAFRHNEFAITTGNATAYESSPGVERTFCGRCGTSLTLADDRFPDEIYVSVSSFDDAEKLPPEFHIWRSHRLSWLETSDTLPRYVRFRADGIVEEQPGRS